MTTFEVSEDIWPGNANRGRPPNPLWDQLAKSLIGDVTLRVTPEAGKDVRMFAVTVRKMLAQRGLKVNVATTDEAIYVRLTNPPAA